MSADWLEPLRNSALEKIMWIFSPRHADVTGKEQADSLAGSIAINNNLILDPPTVLQCVKKSLFKIDLSAHHILSPASKKRT